MTAIAAMNRPVALWRNARFRRIAFQVVFALCVLVLLNFILERAFDLGFGYDFMDRRAGFGAEGKTIPDLSSPFDLQDYGANNSYRDAYVLGLLNTMRVAAIGILLASIVGLIAGVARLSGNWLVSHLAAAYVEVFRNTPLIVQLVFWYSAVFLQLPPISESVSLFDVVFVSNRAAAIPSLSTHEGIGLFLAVGAIGVIAGLVVHRLLIRQHERTGQERYPGWTALAVFAGVAGLGFLASGLPLSVDIPDRGERSYSGGLQMSPEFAALLVALVLYTGAFIAEVVRGSILAIPRAQTEAAAALGLNFFQRLNLVVLPQALRIMIPPLTNQYLNLTKNSSLAVAIAFPELVSVSRTIINQTGEAVSMVVLVMATYLTLSLTISLVMNTINWRLRSTPG
ncbi:MAG TPA: ABC transporter permease subunit [Dehalococcoidia bacterium]|nr:ABC transporter permease subunit [Dehalococcoidia bacterium]